MKILSVFKRKYYPLNTIQISAKALRDNYFYLSKLALGVTVAPVLKSNGYGHGIQLVAKTLDDVGAPFFCVDSLYEAYELQKAKIKTPILIMGYVDPRNLQNRNLPFSFAVYDKEQLKALNMYQQDAKIHIFVDTGMHREGISPSDLPSFLNLIKSFKNIKVEGLMSHLGAGDNIFATQKQIETFNDAKKNILDSGFRPVWYHIAASSGLLHNADYKKSIGNLARCGIALYGIEPERINKNLKPVLTFKTTLSQIKKLKKGEKVGYDFTYTAKKDMTIGVLPAGYFDGIDRRFSNIGYVSIGKTPCPILGRVSMNVTTIDISDVQNPQVGDEVIIFSDKIFDKNSIVNGAILAETIPYDLVVHLASTTRRIGV